MLIEHLLRPARTPRVLGGVTQSPRPPAMDDDDARPNADRVMIERAWAGDVAARRGLYRRLEPVMQRAIARRLRPLASARGRDCRHDLDDFIQGVWLRLFDQNWRVLSAFDPARGELEAYVAMIADRHVLAVMRTKSRDPYHELPLDHDDLDRRSGPASGAFAQVDSRLELDQLQAFLATQLDDRGLVLFQMLELEGLEPRTVANRAQMSTSAVYQWRCRFRVLVRRWREARETGPRLVEQPARQGKAG